jgi:hypothetical protein
MFSEYVLQVAGHACQHIDIGEESANLKAFSSTETDITGYLFFFLYSATCARLNLHE